MERIIQIMKKSKTRFLAALLGAACLISGCSHKPIQYMKYGEKVTRDISYHLDKNEDKEVYELMADGLTVLEKKSVNLLKNNPSFNAEAIFVSNETKERPVYAKNVYKKLYPASLTKLMTAYVTLKHAPDLKKEVVITEEARRITEPFAKMMGLMTNDHISVEALLNATLVHSSNDAAKALAFEVAGSEEGFVKLMNHEAMNLGAVNTNFSNPHGLHEEANYTTLYDLYLIFHALNEDERFLKIVGQKEYVATYKNGLGGKVVKTLKSTNQYFLGNYPIPSGYTIYGGKTGTTNEAGYCMMIYSASGSDKYVVGILKATDQINLYAGFSSIFENIP